MSPRRVLSALIVDDEPRFRRFLTDVARGMDLEVRSAGSASEAMPLIVEGAPDLLLLDLNLPVVDGMEMLERFRGTCPAAQVIIITGFGSLDAARRAIRLEVSDFLTKPCELGQLEAAIDRARRRVWDAGDSGTAPTDPAPRVETPPLASVEREAIIGALRRLGGNRSEAARKLGISRRALYNKIEEYKNQGHAIP